MREVELIPNSCIQEDFMVVVVVLKDIVQFFDALFVVNIVVGNVTILRELIVPSLSHQGHIPMANMPVKWLVVFYYR